MYCIVLKFFLIFALQNIRQNKLVNKQTNNTDSYEKSH